MIKWRKLDNYSGFYFVGCGSPLQPFPESLQ